MIIVAVEKSTPSAIITPAMPAREQDLIFLCENYSGLSDGAFYAFGHEAAPGADGFFDGDYLTSRFFRRQYPLRRGADDRVGGVFVFIEKKVNGGHFYVRNCRMDGA